MTLPYALKLADQGIDKAVSEDLHLAKGINVYKGAVTYDNVARALGYPYTPLAEVLS